MTNYKNAPIQVIYENTPMPNLNPDFVFRMSQLDKIISIFKSNGWIELKIQYVQEDSKYFRSNDHNSKLRLVAPSSEKIFPTRTIETSSFKIKYVLDNSRSVKASSI